MCLVYTRKYIYDPSESGSGGRHRPHMCARPCDVTRVSEKQQQQEKPSTSVPIKPSCANRLSCRRRCRYFKCDALSPPPPLGAPLTRRCRGCRVVTAAAAAAVVSRVFV